MSGGVAKCQGARPSIRGRGQVSGGVARTDLDACVPQHLQGGPDVGLQLVLHAGQAQQLHLPLQALHHGRHLQPPVVDAQLGLVVPVLDGLEEGGGVGTGQGRGGGTDEVGGGGCRGSRTSKSRYCSSDRDFFATTRVRSPSLAMFPHFGGREHVLWEEEKKTACVCVFVITSWRPDFPECDNL